MFSISNVPVKKTRVLTLLLFLGDFIIILFASILSFRLRYGNYVLIKDEWDQIVIFLISYQITIFFFEFYNIKLSLTTLRYLTRVIVMNIIGLISAIILGYIFYAQFTKGFLILWALNFLIFFLFWRYIFYLLSKKPMLPEKVLLVGSDWSMIEIIREINKLPYYSYNIIGLISDKNPDPDFSEFEGVKVIGNRYDLVNIVKNKKIDRIIVSTYEEKHRDLVSALFECRLMGIQANEMPNFYRQITGKIPIRHVKDSWFIFSSGFESVRSPFVFRVKRIIDLLASLLVLIIAVPLIIIIIILIKIDSHGPVFYFQERLGLNEKPFKLIKFRTMRSDAEDKSGPIWAQKNDTRISRIGKILRPTRLDEIPQLINVLKGEMSLVGPRPERPYFVEKLKRQIPYYSLRFSIKPGITGWAQVKYGYGTSLEDTLEKLQYDLYYIQNISLVLDLYIFLKTFQIMLTAREWNELWVS